MRKNHLSFDPLTIANIVIGIILIINPEFSTAVICILLGIVSLIWGIFSIYKHFFAKKYGYKSKFDIFQGVAGILLSFIFIFCYNALASFLPIPIGIAIIFQSISKIRMAIFQKRSGARKWSLPMCLNIMSLILGTCLIINPFKSFPNVIRLIGIVLLINGITRLFTDFFFSREMDKISRDNDDNAIDVTFKDL